jgi:phospholipid/cholesterol/gamma-HCH transport system substrate-binding protein
VERNPVQEIKVGLFVFFFLGLIALASFILGGGEDIFAREFTLHTTYADMKGMKVGAVVRLAGVDIGEVSRVEFSEDPARKDIEVDLKVRETYHERIREDSVASINQIGVLGDMYVSITVGSADKPVIPGEGHIQGIAPPSVTDYAATATEIVQNAASISKKVDLMLGSDEAASKAEIAASLERIGLLLKDAKEGKGVLHTLLYDKATADHIQSMVANADGIVSDVHDITTHVRSGDGIASAIIYGHDGKKLSAQLGEAADAIDGLLTDLREQDSLVHSLIYDPEKAKMVDELTAAATSLHGIMASVDEGEGTVGLLVKDPQLYEDLRTLLGGAQRSTLLRAYIRATMAKDRDEQGKGFEAPEPEK